MANTNVSNRFVLLFNSNIGRSVRISIPRAYMDKDAAAVEANMDAIIANGAVLSGSSGAPASIKAAKTVATERRVIV